MCLWNTAFIFVFCVNFNPSVGLAHNLGTYGVGSFINDVRMSGRGGEGRDAYNWGQTAYEDVGLPYSEGLK